MTPSSRFSPEMAAQLEQQRGIEVLTHESQGNPPDTRIDTTTASALISQAAKHCRPSVLPPELRPSDESQ